MQCILFRPIKISNQGPTYYKCLFKLILSDSFLHNFNETNIIYLPFTVSEAFCCCVVDFLAGMAGISAARASFSKGMMHTGLKIQVLFPIVTRMSPSLSMSLIRPLAPRA